MFAYHFNLFWTLNEQFHPRFGVIYGKLYYVLLGSLQEFMAFHVVQLDCDVHFDQKFGQFD